MLSISRRRIDGVKVQALTCAKVGRKRGQSSEAHHRAADGDRVDSERSRAGIRDSELLTCVCTDGDVPKSMAFRRDGKDRNRDLRHFCNSRACRQ